MMSDLPSRAGVPARPPRRKADISGIFPLTPQQQGLLVHAREPGGEGAGGDPYFSQDLLILEGELDAARFEAAWADVVARHAVLRTDFRWEDVPQPMQIVFRQRPSALTWLDWRDEADAEATLARHLAGLREEGFDFRHAADPRLTLARVGPARWFLIWSYHHIAIDGWSYALVLRDLLSAYHARLKGSATPLPPAPPFSDYLAWLSRQDGAAAEAFWRRELAGLDDVPTPLPLARPLRPAASRFGELSLSLPGTAVLAAFVQRERITLGSLCQGLWALLLGRLSAQHRVSFGVTVSGRPADLPDSADIAGLFINTLPLSVKLDGALCVGDWLRGIQSQNARLRQFEHVSLARIQALSAGAGRSLFESLLVIENFPVDAALLARGEAAPGELRARLHLPEAGDGEVLATPRARNNYPLTLVFVPGGSGAADQPARLVFAYDRRRFDDQAVRDLAGHARTLLDTLLDGAARPLDEIALATPAQAAALTAWGEGAWDTPTAPAYRSLPSQFAQWVRHQPEAPAIRAADGEWSRAELQERATRLAQALRAQGVGAGARVALLSERSAAFVAGLLGVMQCGAAFLPLDPAQPPQRLAQLLADAGPALLLAQDLALGRSIAATVPVWQLGAEPAAHPELALPDELPAQSAAYVIYTSGSTGTPKGAVLTHAGLAQYAAGLQTRLRAAAGWRHAMVSTVAADLGHTTLFGALASGGTLCLLPAALAFDPDGFAHWMREQDIDVLKIVPSHLAGLLAAETPALPRQALVLGGEAAGPALLQRVRELAEPSMRLLNHYGPTEATVGVLTEEIPLDQALPQGPVPLGRPLPGCRLLVLDNALQPLPPGAAGELYIGGHGLARAYLGRPDLTADRFVPDPSRPGERLYRSGDRVAWRSDGHLLFLGRIDEQVKIRGHRVEPHELAAALRALPGVQDAAVAVRAGEQGALRLLAYVTPASLQVETLRQALAARLPEPLLPAALVPLASLPLTPNGKLDRCALPDPLADTPAPSDEGGDGNPRTATEKTLADIWAAVLQHERIGLHDNFFELGGDSILNLQVIARARRAGLRITPRQVFEHPTIARLAAMATPLAPAAAPAPSRPDEDDAPLTPIQHWFFATPQPEPDHWNQAVLLSSDRPLDAARLGAALSRLVARHDALRLRFKSTPQGWRQRVAPPGTPWPAPECFDLSACSDDEADAEIERLGTRLQQGLNLSQGPLLRAACFDLGPRRPGRLLLAAHHLAIDSVSWRLLIGELQALCEEPAATSTLPATGLPYLAWARRLAREAVNARAELAHWQASAGEALPAGADMRYTAARRHRMQLPRQATAALLGHAPTALRCRSEELLLTALAQALCEAAGQHAVSIELEGHGREAAFADDDETPDLSTTVGWFTCRYPVRLAPGRGDPLAALRAVVAQLRAVPGKGLGHGLLRYLDDDHAVREALAAVPAPGLCFNYLGQLDAGLSDGWLHPVDGPTGPTRSPRNRRSHPLDVDAHVAHGQLQVEWTWAPGAQHDAASIESLANGFMQRLQALLALADQAPQASAADFPLARLNEAELRSLQSRWPQAEDIYPLAPLQAGMLFHSLDPRARQPMYLNQLHCEIRSPLQPALFEQAWHEAMARHPVLRSVFAWDGLDEPHQLVLPRAELPVRRLTLPDAAALQAFLHEDLAEGFALDRGPLMRLGLIELPGAWHMVWTRHHLLLDGWSSARLLMEVFRRYDTLVRGRVPAARPPPRPYRDHIARLQQRDAAAEQAWWRDQLAGLAEPTLLQNHAGHGCDDTRLARLVRPLETGLGDALAGLARQQHLTVNTLVQAAWAYVLSRHVGRRDVVFGITVSGRPAELAGADAMLGLFINTLPLRVRLPAGLALSDWWQGLQRHNAELREHEQAQLAQLQGLAGLPPGTPLFDTLLVFENYPVDRAGLDALRDTLDIAAVEADETLSLPMTLIVYPGRAMTVEFAYQRGAFDADAVARLADQFCGALRDFVHMAAQPIAALALQPASAAAPIAPAAAGGSLVSRFEAQAARHPEAIALCGDGPRLSYGELNRQANRLARCLIAQGVGPEVPVALCLERSNALAVAILGVLKAGGCYVPLDPASPAERLRHIVADSGARCLLHDGPGCGWQEELAIPALRLDALPQTPDEDDTSGNPPPRATAQQLAYVIYTSGSTGVPKGVPVTHANVMRLFDSSDALFRFGPQDVWTLFHSCAFDFSVWELWGAWLHGGRLVLVPQAAARDTAVFFELLCRERVTVLNQTPSAFYPLAELALAGAAPDWALRCVIFGGEALDPRRLLPWCERFGDTAPQLVNMYGITETTVHVTHRRLRQHELGQRSLIGQALPDLQLQVLDDAMQPLPAGVAGELYVGGPGLARGYLGQPGLTAERFVPDPWGRAGARLYRSGDLGRRLDTGEFEYLGRADQQVKVRGFRIEPGEIEAQLRRAPGVAQVAVLARPDPQGATQLLACVVPDGPADLQALRRHAREHLPAYMVPAAFVALQALPLTVNGKLDRRALLALADAADEERPAVSRAPRDALERQIAALWCELLKLEQIDIDADFFMLGGHSLLAARAVARLRQATGLALGIADLFEHPTVAGLARHIGTRLTADQPDGTAGDTELMSQLLDELEQEST